MLDLEAPRLTGEGGVHHLQEHVAAEDSLLGDRHVHQFQGGVDAFEADETPWGVVVRVCLHEIAHLEVRIGSQETGPRHVKGARVERQFDLDKPIYVQYVSFLQNVVKGDLGESARRREPVTDILRERLPKTLFLVAYSMVLAVLEAHCGVRLSGHDVYLNVAGGLRIAEPAADLAVAAALVSSLAHAPLPADAVYFGEVSLSGAVRPVSQVAARLKEAQKLGFARAILPEAARAEAVAAGMALTPVGMLANLAADIAATGSRGRRPGTSGARNDNREDG